MCSNGLSICSGCCGWVVLPVGCWIFLSASFSLTRSYIFGHRHLHIKDCFDAGDFPFKSCCSLTSLNPTGNEKMGWSRGRTNQVQAWNWNPCWGRFGPWLKLKTKLNVSITIKRDDLLYIMTGATTKPTGNNPSWWTTAEYFPQCQLDKNRLRGADLLTLQRAHTHILGAHH